MGHHATTFITAMLIGGASLGLAGCHTAEGFGTDMSNSWHWVTGSGSSSSEAAAPAPTQTASTPPAASGSSQHTATASAAPATHKPHATSGSSEPGGLSRSQIKQAQTKLHDDGYYSGPIDGIIGAETRSAVIAYQTKAGIKANGELTPETMASLSGSKM
jgi:His-Xaa-Ser repeat protein HxsA